MINVKEAERIINDNLLRTDKVKVNINQAQNKLLRENIFSDRESPPFDRVTMDGIAINYYSFEKGNRVFKIEGSQKAGDKQLQLQSKNSCIEVMTGTGLPLGCDCVIKVEDIDMMDNQVHIKKDTQIEIRQNIHTKGSDYPAKKILINHGTELLSTHIGVIASVGKSEILVTKPPSIAIISTGDELVDLDKTVETHQIRMSNSYALQATLKANGFENIEIFHLIDDKEILKNKLDNILQRFDVIILSGGVSMGKFDFIPEILEELSVKNLFHKISQRPGKPFWFGITKDKKPVFALPGNPVSTIICFYRYIVNYLKLSMGYHDIENEFAILAEDYTFSPKMTCFLPVKLKNDKGQLNAYPIITNTSGDYASLVNSDGFLELPAEENYFPEGYVARLYRWQF